MKGEIPKCSVSRALGALVSSLGRTALGKCCPQKAILKKPSTYVFAVPDISNSTKTWSAQRMRCANFNRTWLASRSSLSTNQKSTISNSDKSAALDDGKMAKLARGHALHGLVDCVGLRARPDLPRHHLSNGLVAIV